MPSAQWLKMMQIDEDRRSGNGAKPKAEETKPLPPKKQPEKAPKAVKPELEKPEPTVAGAVYTERKPKEPVYIRLDADLLAAIKATGPGWQTRLNDLLRTHFKPNQF